MLRIRVPRLALVGASAPTGIVLSGIGPTVAFGALAVSGAVVPAGIASSAAFGAPVVGGGIALVGFSTTAIGNPTVSGDGTTVAPESIEPTTAIGSPLVTVYDAFDDPDAADGLTQIFSGVGEVSQILQPADLTSAPEEGIAVSRRTEPRIRKLWQVRVEPCSRAFAETAKLAHRRTHGAFYFSPPRSEAPRKVVFFGEGLRVQEANGETCSVTATMLELVASD